MHAVWFDNMKNVLQKMSALNFLMGENEYLFFAHQPGSLAHPKFQVCDLSFCLAAGDLDDEAGACVVLHGVLPGVVPAVSGTGWTRPAQT